MWKRVVCRLLHDEAGQDLVEYALVAVVIGLGTVVSLHGLAGKVANVLNTVGNTMTSNV